MRKYKYQKKCKYCSKDYIGEKDSIFCSKNCKSRSQFNVPLGEKTKIKVSCNYCGKSKEINRCFFKRNQSKLFFCNKQCRAKHEKISKLGKRNPSYKNGKYSQSGKCLTCGKQFYRKSGKAKYCSQRCRPNVGYRYIQGRRYEYKAIKKLKNSGFQIVIRSARSQGIFDVFAIKGNNKTRKINEVRCIQVKATTSNFPVKSIVPKNERENISNNKFIPIIGRNIFYEIWVWRIRKGWDTYRLNWKTREFEKL